MYLLMMLMVWGSPNQKIVLLDGSTVHVVSARLDHSMVCCDMPDGLQMFMSLGMVDWERMKRVNPEIFLAFFPNESLEPAEKIQRDRKSIVITNDDLKSMPQSANQPPPSMVADSGKVAPRRNGPVIEKIGVPGERVDIRQHMEQDMTVVFDFYADWCGPCRQLTPKLEALARKYPDKIAVKKIDIVRWNTPVAQQFGISSIPYLEVYDASGKKIRNGNGFTVLQYVEKMASGW